MSSYLYVLDCHASILPYILNKTQCVTESVTYMRKDILERKDEIIEWIKQNKSKAFMCKQLQCKQHTLNSYLNKMNIVYAGNQKGIGNKAPNYMTTIEYINSTYVKSSVLKEKLIKEV